MDKLTSISFNVFKFSAAVFILLYFVLTVIVGSAGHSSGDDFLTFLRIALFSILLFLLIHYYQKRTINGDKVTLVFRIPLVVMLLISITIAVLGIYAVVDHWMGMLSIILCLILGMYLTSGLFILKFIFWGKKQLL